ncbi:MAG: class I SAM-dependent methyltransferase [Chlamydiota bacterium]
MEVKKRSTCRISGGELVDVLDLGSLPFSCFPSIGALPPKSLPLVLSFNSDSGLLQLRHTVNPDEMYNEYWYMSGVNQSMKDALKSIVVQAIARQKIPLKPGDIVVDIASNDGTLLSAYPESLFRVGIDPAKNIKPKNCNLHINTYFTADAYSKQLGDRKAEIVTSIAMFYDLENPIQFAKDVHQILTPNGLWIIELSYLPTMLERNSFDTICSEHLEYYSLRSMEYILTRSGFLVEDVELNDVNGGSFRLYIRKESFARPTQAVAEMRESEKALKLTDPQTYKTFASRIKRNKKEMIDFLKTQKEMGKKVIGYGASTKGNTIMSYYGLGPDLISFVADRNPMKYGRTTVTGIPIISEEDARKMKPDYFLAFPYHFMNEFIRREADFIQRGGQFVSPIPSLTIFPFKRALDSSSLNICDTIKS